VAVFRQGHARTFTVVHAGGSTPVTVNQQAQGGQWVTLGSFTLTPGQNHRVELRPVAGGAVVADAVRITREVTTAAQVYNIFADHLDTPRVITKADTTQQVVWQWFNDAGTPEKALAIRRLLEQDQEPFRAIRIRVVSVVSIDAETARLILEM
jgi:hypothetical protein